MLFDDFGDSTGFDAAYLLSEDGSILEIIAEPEARTEHLNSWDESAFIAAIDRWVHASFAEEELDDLRLQIFPEGPGRNPSEFLKIIH